MGGLQQPSRLPNRLLLLDGRQGSEPRPENLGGSPRRIRSSERLEHLAAPNPVGLAPLTKQGKDGVDAAPTPLTRDRHSEREG